MAARYAMLRLSRHVRHNPVASREPKRAVRHGAKMKLRNRSRVLRSRRRRKRSLASQDEWTDGAGVQALVTAARESDIHAEALPTRVRGRGNCRATLPALADKNLSKLRAQHCPDQII